MIPQDPIYVVDIIADVVQSVIDDVLDDIQANETAAIGMATAIQTINYQYGHKSELVETLAQMDKTDKAAFQKYPCIYVVQDFKETIGLTPGFYGAANLNIIIMHHSQLDYKTTERYANVFKPVLYPIYLSFLTFLSKHANIITYNPPPKHDKFDRPLTIVTGKDSAGSLYINDYVDAIEIQNLILTIDSQTCIN